MANNKKLISDFTDFVAFQFCNALLCGFQLLAHIVNVLDQRSASRNFALLDQLEVDISCGPCVAMPSVAHLTFTKSIAFGGKIGYFAVFAFQLNAQLPYR